MSNNPIPEILLHEDTLLFRESINFTTAATGFITRLIEKDYFCSVILSYLMNLNTPLIFKGGTCLAKIYANFYRMSEDLDFTISVADKSKRSERRNKMKKVKDIIAKIPTVIPIFKIIEPLSGANVSTHYKCILGYKSIIYQQQEFIKLEIGLREPLITREVIKPASTLILNPVTGLQAIPVFNTKCLSKLEIFAEKFRAALTRREPAIRDFYDIDYAIQKLGLKLTANLVSLIKNKIAIPGNDSVNVSSDKFFILKKQFETQLKAVLRDKDFKSFNLENAFKTVKKIAKLIQ